MKNTISTEKVLMSNHFKIPKVQLLCTTNFLCMCSTIGAHAQEVWGKFDKDQSSKKAATHDFKSDLPLVHKYNKGLF